MTRRGEGVPEQNHFLRQVPPSRYIRNLFWVAAAILDRIAFVLCGATENAERTTARQRQRERGRNRARQRDPRTLTDYSLIAFVAGLSHQDRHIIRIMSLYGLAAELFADMDKIRAASTTTYKARKNQQQRGTSESGVREQLQHTGEGDLLPRFTPGGSGANHVPPTLELLEGCLNDVQQNRYGRERGMRAR